MELRITGLEQVQRRLKEAPSLLVAKAFHQALDRAAGVFAGEVEMRCEEMEELAENVIVDVEVDVAKQGGTAFVGFSHTPSERTGKPLDLIAMWIEFGHMVLTHKGETPSHGKTHVPADPFMRPAFDAAAERALEVFQETLIDGLSVIEES